MNWFWDPCLITSIKSKIKSTVIGTDTPIDATKENCQALEFIALIKDSPLEVWLSSLPIEPIETNSGIKHIQTVTRVISRKYPPESHKIYADLSIIDLIKILIDAGGDDIYRIILFDQIRIDYKTISNKDFNTSK